MRCCFKTRACMWNRILVTSIHNSEHGHVGNVCKTAYNFANAMEVVVVQIHCKCNGGSRKWDALVAFIVTLSWALSLCDVLCNKGYMSLHANWFQPLGFASCIWLYRHNLFNFWYMVLWEVAFMLEYNWFSTLFSKAAIEEKWCLLLVEDGIHKERWSGDERKALCRPGCWLPETVDDCRCLLTLPVCFLFLTRYEVPS